MALDTYPQSLAERESFIVGKTQLSCKFIYPWILGQTCSLSVISVVERRPVPYVLHLRRHKRGSGS